MSKVTIEVISVRDAVRGGRGNAIRTGTGEGDVFRTGTGKAIRKKSNTQSRETGESNA